MDEVKKIADFARENIDNLEYNADEQLSISHPIQMEECKKTGSYYFPILHLLSNDKLKMSYENNSIKFNNITTRLRKNSVFRFIG